MNKLRFYLFGREFTWITDCLGILNFMEIEFLPKHQAQRWKLDMLRNDFIVVHRPDKMMTECDLLSRYNTRADELHADNATLKAAKDKETNEPTSSSPGDSILRTPEQSRYQSPTTSPTESSDSNTSNPLKRKVQFNLDKVEVCGEDAKGTPTKKKCKKAKKTATASKATPPKALAFTATGILGSAANVPIHIRRELSTMPEFQQVITPQQIKPDIRTPPKFREYQTGFFTHDGYVTGRTFMAELCDTGRSVLILSSTGIHTIKEAVESTCSGETATFTASFNKASAKYTNVITTTKYFYKFPMNHHAFDWIWIEPKISSVPDDWDALRGFLRIARGRGCTTVIFAWSARQDDESMANVVKGFESLFNREFPDWPTHVTAIFNTLCGGPIERITYVCICTQDDIMKHIRDTDFNIQEETAPLRSVIDPPNYRYSDYQGTEESIDATYPPKEVPVTQAKEIGRIYVEYVHDHEPSKNIQDMIPVMSIDHPGPDFARNPASTKHRHAECEFYIETYDADLPRSSRGIRNHELMAAMGYPHEAQLELLQIPWPVVLNGLKSTTPLHTARRILSSIITAERINKDEQARKPVPKNVAMYCSPTTLKHLSEPKQRQHAYPTIISQWNTMPIPTNVEWKTALQEDEDTKYVIECISTDAMMNYGILHDKAYYKQWKECHLAVEDGILYQWEMPTKQIRQLRRRVVPLKMRYSVFVALHATPMAGHMGMYKTYYRIMTRFWWPKMYTYVTQQVKSCAHCILANNVSHKGQRILQSIETAEPFDIMAFDVWYPGVTTEGDITKKADPKTTQALLTGVCTTTAFAGVALIDEVSSTGVQAAMFAHFFVPNGFPKKILINDGSEFKGELIKCLDFLGIPYEVITPEEHQGILCERFHRFLNKVEKIHGLENVTHEEFYISGLFAAYAWNSAPVDGTNIQRSFSAKARTFKFPIDVSLEEPPPVGNPGERAARHVQDVFPLWRRQLQVLEVLRNDRRAYHLELRNKNKSRQQFDPGDLVVVRKQVTSDAAQGKPAKLQMRAKGVYKVLER